MRIVRVLFVMLVAALLPVRGVMAAAMLCGPTPGATSEMHAMPDSGGDEHGHDDAGVHQHADVDLGATGQFHDDASGRHGCNLCAACCSVPPLARTLPEVPPPHEQAAAAFPDLFAPAPSFVSDGQERPPRSI